MKCVLANLWERSHWLVESCVRVGLHPSLNDLIVEDHLAEMFALWKEYQMARNYRSDNLRSFMASMNDEMYNAASATSVDGPVPTLALYFEPPLYTVVNMA